MKGKSYALALHARDTPPLVPPIFFSLQDCGFYYEGDDAHEAAEQLYDAMTIFDPFIEEHYDR